MKLLKNTLIPILYVSFIQYLHAISYVKLYQKPDAILVIDIVSMLLMLLPIIYLALKNFHYYGNWTGQWYSFSIKDILYLLTLGIVAYFLCDSSFAAYEAVALAGIQLHTTNGPLLAFVSYMFDTIWPFVTILLLIGLSVSRK